MQIDLPYYKKSLSSKGLDFIIFPMDFSQGEGEVPQTGIVHALNIDTKF